MAAEDRASSRLRVGGWIPDGDPAQAEVPEPDQPDAPVRAGGSAWQADRGAGAPPAREHPGEGHARRPTPGDESASRPAATPWPADGHDGRARQPDGDRGEPRGPAVSQRGRRRLDRPTGRATRPAVLAAVATLLVTAVAGVLWAVSSGEPDSQAGGPGTFATGAPAAPASGAPDATGSPTTEATPSVAASSAAPSLSASAKAAAFGPVTYEAEAPGNTLLGQAEVVSLAGASGGRAVRNLGDGAGAKKDGALRFNAITVPEAGTYTLTFYYAQVVGPHADRVTIIVAGGATITATVGGGGSCCASKAVSVRLKAGANAVTFTSTGGPAPAIDRVVVRRA
ncbi:hypothetical protein CS0771_27590 [Catellatospora sp. IY07-71]|uniref:hypothetical protein n=1 Tax=Catellatospora sp. IY07-71 TaxID=2728827 RepID=UPI001BB32FF4|nr:hypothetical protein [Catellatospora sp. IY07-71]BCJ73215.1 hypothetical protein CS0771_27590 [Catellatospora sp. IY07-71]